MKDHLLVAAAVAVLGACTSEAPRSELPSSTATAVSSLTASASDSPAAAGAETPQPDLCGTWEAIELSVTTPVAPSGQPDRKDSRTSAHTFCRPVGVHVPLAVDALGDPGLSDVSLSFQSFSPASPSVPAVVTCKYHAGPKSRSSYDFVACNHGFGSGSAIVAQKFTLGIDYQRNSASTTARVTLRNGSSPPAGAYTEYLGTTPNLMGVALRIPAGSLEAYSGVGLVDGAPFEHGAFVANEPDGLVVVGPSVKVTGGGAFPPGVHLTVPFDAAWVSTLLAGVDVAPVNGAAIDPATQTLGADLANPGAFLTTIRDLTPLTRHDGPLMDHGVHVYIVWAGDFDAMAAADDPRPTVRQFLADLPQSSWYDILSTYGITNRRVTLSGEIARKALTTITSPYADAVSPELGRTLAVDADGIYLVIAANGVTAPKLFCGEACGWHTWAPYTDTAGAVTPIKLAFIGSPVACGGCRMSMPSINGVNVDSVVTVMAHEIVEAATDPQLNAWHGASELGALYSGSVENADKCAWVFHSIQTDPVSRTQYNVVSNGHRYIVQSNWVNQEDGYCAMGIESVAIAVTPPPGTLLLNQVGTFAVTVTNTSPVQMDAGEFVVLGAAEGLREGESLPIRISSSMAPGQSVTVTVPVQAPLEITGNVEDISFVFQVRDPSNLHTFGTRARVTVPVQRAAVLFDQSECVSVSMPATASVNQVFPVTMTFKNVGSTRWLANDYRLVGEPLDLINPYLQSPQLLAASVDPGGSARLTFNVRVPDGTYGAPLNVGAAIANSAAAFQTGCGGTAQVLCILTAGQACGACGTVQCDGSCSRPTPDDYGQPCGSCGGTYQCDGSCSVATPPGIGSSCGACGGKVLCDATCSVGTPPEHVLYTSSYSTNIGVPPTEISVFQGACPDGEIRGSCTATRTEGTESCWSYWATDDPHDCTCMMHVGARLFQSLACTTIATEQPCP
jgi:hypothetical protein